MLIRRIAPVAAILGLVLAPLFAHAAIFSSIADVVAKACIVVNWLFTGAILITIVFVLLAAIKYITKGSDPSEVAKAHQMLIWAAIGFAIAVLANVMPQFIAGILGAPGVGTC